MSLSENLSYNMTLIYLFTKSNFLKSVPLDLRFCRSVPKKYFFRCILPENSVKIVNWLPYTLFHNFL